jgi:hypothetical protein
MTAGLGKKGSPDFWRHMNIRPIGSEPTDAKADWRYI